MNRKMNIFMLVALLCGMFACNNPKNPGRQGDIWGGGGGSGGSATVNGATCNTGSSCDVSNLFDSNGLAGAQLVTTTGAVNMFQITEAATGNPLSLSPGGTGSDTNIGLTIGVKGTGALTLNGASSSSIVDNATGAIKITVASGVLFSVQLTGTGGFNVLGGSSATSQLALLKYGNAAPTADAIDLQSSGGAALGPGMLGPSGIVQSTGTQIVTGADYTNTGSSFTTVWSWTLPPTVSAKSYTYSCAFMWESTSTTLVGPNIDVNISAAPTQLTAAAHVSTAVAGTYTDGYLSNTTTGAQALFAGVAAAVTSTNYPGRIWGTIEGAATAGSTFTISMEASSSTTAILNVRRGSSCALY